jgi:hypothetical protein
MKNSIIAFVIILFIFYLAGSFAFASFYIKEWNEVARGFISFFALCIATPISATIYLEKK